MTTDPRSRQERGATPALVVLAASLAVYLAAELFPVGVQSLLAEQLDTSPARVGLLLTGYAVAAGAVTLPTVWWARRLPPRTALPVAHALLAVSMAWLALADDWSEAVAARAVSALAHGFVWSQVPVVAVALVPAGRASRATSTVFLGSSIGLLAGAPASAAVAQLVGARSAALGLAALSLVVAVALRGLLPDVGASGDRRAARRPGVLRTRKVALLCLTTAVLVTGHYVGYGYLEPVLVSGGWGGALLAPSLSAYGAAGLLGVVAFGSLGDRHPRPAAALVCSGLVLGVALPAVASTTVMTAVGVLLWGAAAGALPVTLTTSVLRAAGPAADLGSAAYVVAYQVGIAAGAALGSPLVGAGTRPLLVVATAVALAGAVLLAVVDRPQGTTKPPGP